MEGISSYGTHSWGKARLTALQAKGESGRLQKYFVKVLLRERWPVVSKTTTNVWAFKYDYIITRSYNS